MTSEIEISHQLRGTPVMGTRLRPADVPRIRHGPSAGIFDASGIKERHGRRGADPHNEK